MKITVRKTDKRYTGSDVFGYVVDIKNTSFAIIHTKLNKSQKIKQFQEVRDWCIQTWGMSCEREHYLQMTADDFPTNEHWCWHTEFYDTKIYLCTEKEANWFKLKWL
jgi:hypothetical protein